MIVADTNLLAYLLIPGPFAADAERVLKADGVWMAPRQWRSEFLNVLSRYVRTQGMSVADAVDLMAEAERIMGGQEVPVEAEHVLSLAAASGCSSYDCEFVAAARVLGVPLVTLDGKVLTAFPTVAVSLRDFASA